MSRNKNLHTIYDYFVQNKNEKEHKSLDQIHKIFTLKLNFYTINIIARTIYGDPVAQGLILILTIKSN